MYIIGSIFIAGGLGWGIWIYIRHAREVQTAQVYDIPATRQQAKKHALINGRLDRQLGDLYQRVSKRVRPSASIVSSFMQTQVQRVRELEHNFLYMQNQKWALLVPCKCQSHDWRNEICCWPDCWAFFCLLLVKIIPKSKQKCNASTADAISPRGHG